MSRISESGGDVMQIKRQYVLISLYIPHNMKPRMKIATEDFLFGLVPKYPSFYWYSSSEEEISSTDPRETKQ